MSDDVRSSIINTAPLAPIEQTAPLVIYTRGVDAHCSISFYPLRPSHSLVKLACHVLLSCIPRRVFVGMPPACLRHPLNSLGRFPVYKYVVLSRTMEVNGLPFLER